MTRNITLIFCLLSLTVLSQTKIDTKLIQEQFPDEDLYYLTDKTKINISIRDNKLDIESEISNEILFLNDKARMFARKSIYFYDEMEQISNIVAATYVEQENGKLKKFPVDKIYIHKPIKDGIFYDDFKETYFDYPGLKKNSIASISYRQKYLDPHFISPFFFANASPSGDMEYSVTFPKSVNLKYLVKGDTTGLEFSSKDSKNEINYTWKINGQKKFEREMREGNYRRYAPHVILYIDNYTLNGKTVNVNGSIRQLYDWYYSHISDLIEDNSVEVKNLADSLTMGITDEDEKIKKIYYWVQDNIKYIAFEYGLGGFIPRKSGLVCTRRFGDCKDKSSLLHALFRAAGIKSYFTWIGTREIPYSYTELPTPASDNHMIVAMQRKGEWIFLDGTASNLPFGYPSGFIQEKEALIGISSDSFLIQKVPVVEKEKNYNHDIFSMRLSGDDLTGTGDSYYGGLWRYELTAQFANISENKKEEEISKMLRYGNNKCRVDSLHFSGIEGYSDTLHFNFVFTIPNYVRKIDNKIFVNMNISKRLSDEKVEIEKRKTEMPYKFKFVVSESASLEIPEGYNVTKIPVNKKYSGKYFGFTINYEKQDGKIFLRKSIYFDELEKLTDQFGDWNKMVEEINEAYAEVVVLEKP